MRFSPAFLEEIRDRVPVSEVAGLRVKLRKEGREWRGLSPFNAEKTPSFFVNDHKRFFHDFSSGKSGDIFKFVMETEGVSFPEAVERMAGLAGLALPVETPEAQQRERQRAGLHEVLEWAAAFFEAQLQARGGAKARGYLADRGLPPTVQQDFRIGYAPGEKFALRDHLAGKGASAETMITAGLLVHGNEIAVPYDRFRDRVMFPIADRAGKVIAFGGRALDPAAPAKYLNSPETPLFHKGSGLYNHHRARVAAHDRGDVIAVEGYVDVIAMTMAGFPNAVAPLGTALTPDQCALLWKMAEEPILCFDGDKAGIKAAWRAIDTALPLIGPGRSLRFALLPEGQDPDDLLRRAGPGAVAQVVESAKPLVEVMVLREIEAGPLDTPERRAALERRLRVAVRSIADPDLRRHYGEAIAARIATLFGRDATGNGARTPRRNGDWRGGRAREGDRRGAVFEPASSSGPVVASQSLARSPLFAGPAASTPPGEALIVLLAVSHPALLVHHAEELASIDLEDADAARLRDGLLGAAAALGEMSNPRQFVLDGLEAAGLAPVLSRIRANQAISSLWCLTPATAERDAETVLHQALALHRRNRALNREMRDAEIALGNDPTGETLARLQEIRSELSATDGIEASIEEFGVMSGRLPTSL